MSKNFTEISKEDRRKINEELNNVNKDSSRQTRFDNFQEIQIGGRTFTINELKKITKIIETAEAWLKLESRSLEIENNCEEEQGCIECGKIDKPIIAQCQKCYGAIRECCTDHEANC